MLFNFGLDLPEAFDLFCGRFDDSLGDNFDEALGDGVILVGHVIAYFLSFYFEQPNLYLLNYLLANFFLLLPVGLDLLLDLFYLLGFVQFDLLQLLLDVQQQELLVLGVLPQILEKRLRHPIQVLLKLIK